jgi:hypothetical protein
MILFLSSGTYKYNYVRSLDDYLRNQDKEVQKHPSEWNKKVPFFYT